MKREGPGSRSVVRPIILAFRASDSGSNPGGSTTHFSKKNQWATDGDEDPLRTETFHRRWNVASELWHETGAKRQTATFRFRGRFVPETEPNWRFGDVRTREKGSVRIPAGAPHYFSEKNHWATGRYQPSANIDILSSMEYRK